MSKREEFFNYINEGYKTKGDFITLDVFHFKLVNIGFSDFRHSV